MNVYADIAVSHQWENNLNYLYFDLAWMGWPIVHNALFCKDVGYYYSEFNYEEGGKQLLNAIYNHDNNIEEYIIRNRKAIDKYLTTNLELQKKYIELINNLYEDENENENEDENENENEHENKNENENENNKNNKKRKNKRKNKNKNKL
jgi:hypothetical protein